MSERDLDFDVVVIGAGVAGMYMLHLLRKQGLKVRVFETGTGVGGTWYWNRYPGARFDSESYSYGYSFSKELLDEWEWTEHFAPQPETLSYLNYVADKFDLRRDIQFETRIESAYFDDDNSSWEVTTDGGEKCHAKYLVTAMGMLSAAFVPDYEGVNDFQGDSWHTSTWPKEAVDFSDKRVAVIGTGATAVQLIPELGKQAGHMTVFQRTANYIIPARNSDITPEEQKDIKANYDGIFSRCKETFGAFLHDFDPRSALEVTDEEREKKYEELYSQRGFPLWLGNFFDILTDKDANATISDFARRKIRERIKDPENARKLVPDSHMFGTKRVPLDHGYYETFDRENVSLIDLNEEPIEKITTNGIKTSQQELEFDYIVFATGFDAITGAFKKVDIRGRNGQSLLEKWADGPRTLLGMQASGFPNMFTITGPTNASTFCNLPRCIEQNVEWIDQCVKYMEDNELSLIEATEQAEDEWTEHVNEMIEQTLLPQTNSWFMGANIPGKKRTFLSYSGGSPVYRERCDNIAANGYTGFDLS
ncbi:MAG: NAD(P)/FAD-dependent oxidoreductase [Pseudomonadota bacterium]